MGVDWVPCRVEPGCTREEIDQLIRLEALHFRALGNSSAGQIDVRVVFSDAQQAEAKCAYQEHGPLHQRLHFKHAGHRVSVVTQEELFPIEWRIDAERTIAPWELSRQLAVWNDYREEVARGLHRAYLRQLFIYLRIHSLISVEVANLTSVARDSTTSTGGWATRAEVVACRDEILTEEILPVPLPPCWPDGNADANMANVQSSFDRVTAAIHAWNSAVQRGNKRVRIPERPLPFDEWIAQRLQNQWYSSFLAWVHPWKMGGYGLYRDCE